MKRISAFLILFSLLTTSCFVSAQQVIVTDDASYTTPASGAMLDVKSTSKGFMPPRVALTSLTDVATIATPSTGLIVYNTGTAGLAESGIYYWNGTIWTKPITGGSGGTNYVSIATDGTVILHGAATTWNDLVVNPAVGKNSGVNVPAWSAFGSTGIYTFTFLDAQTTDVNFTVQLPHNYKEGTDIYPHIHWASSTSSGLNRVEWELVYQWVNHTESFNATTSNVITGSVITGTPRSVAAYENVITPIVGSGVSGGIPGSGKKISSLLICKLSRNGSATADNFQGSASLLSVDFHYEIDSFGSRGEYTKDTE